MFVFQHEIAFVTNLRSCAKRLRKQNAPMIPHQVMGALIIILESILGKPGKDRVGQRQQIVIGGV